MSRVLLAMVFAVGLVGSANAATMMFSVDGAPIGPGQVVEVVASQVVEIDVWVELEPGESYDFVMANVVPTGEWDPVMPLTPGDVAWVPPWGTNDAKVEPPGSIMPGVPTGTAMSDSLVVLGLEVDVSGSVLSFPVHIPDVPESTILNFEYVTGEMIATFNTKVLLGSTALPLTLVPLELHVTPEPATLGLLVLGGLAALRRRFA